MQVLDFLSGKEEEAEEAGAWRQECTEGEGGKEGEEGEAEGEAEGGEEGLGPSSLSTPADQITLRLES